MKKYAPEVQKRIDLLNNYVINNKLINFNICHLYPKKIAYPDGYYDSMFFDLHLFNTFTNEKRIIKNRDGLDFLDIKYDIKLIRIYADGSTIITFNSIYKVCIFQSVTIE
jgi:hypothetical protein